MIVHKQGSVLASTADIIAHQVNCQGVMGAGLAKQIKRKFPNVFESYQKRCQEAKAVNRIPLGDVQLVYILATRQYVANLFAQNGYGTGHRMTDYPSLEKCFQKLNSMDPLLTIAIPDHIGCGLAGGDWDGVVYPMIKRIWGNSKQVLEIWHFS